MRILTYVLRGFIFFVLVAFAINNQQPTTVNWFFSYAWTAPMVIIVLAAFAVGAAVGVVAMLPDAWRRWRQVKRLAPPPAPAPAPPPPTSILPSEFGPEQPPRMGP